MSVLHTLSALPGTEACTDCLRMLAEGDALLLMGDGVYAADLAAAKPDVDVFILASDAAARGVSSTPANSEHVSMKQVVQLTVRFERQVAWY